MFHFARLALALTAPLLLLGCVITPGKFVSTLDIGADRSFAFTYVGEVYAIDMANAMSESMSSGLTADPEPEAEPDGASFTPIALQDTGEAAAKKAATETKNRAIAEALAKEAGYRKVDYVGDGKFLIDYAITGTLTHSFVYPFNTDAEVMFPFLAIELRAGNTLRMTAPAFASRADAGPSAMSGMGDPSSKLDGTFTLTTNAEIVSQNNEDGAKTDGAHKTITWRATPLTKTAPLAVLKLAK